MVETRVGASTKLILRVILIIFLFKSGFYLKNDFLVVGSFCFSLCVHQNKAFK
jgi:hypothetical protein